MYDKKFIRDLLFNHIKTSIKNDVGTALESYSNAFFNNPENGGMGFFAIPRLLFPEVDGLGSYLTGISDSTTSNISTYIDEIMSLVDERYKDKGVFIAKVYRHGLLHQHFPKEVNIRNSNIGWWFSIENKNNPIEVQRRYHLVVKDNLLMISMRLFYQDVLDSIDELYPILLSKHTKEFEKAYNEQIKPLTENEFDDKDLEFLN